ncbi:VOC family protein [Micromonospora sp. NPDC003197]
MRSEAPDYFVPQEGAVLTHLLIVRDVDRSREFYQRVLGAEAVRERQPCVLRSRGGEFLTEPKDHGMEIRCYLRDPDGYLIEVGQGTGILAEMGQAPA